MRHTFGSDVGVADADGQTVQLVAEGVESGGHQVEVGVRGDELDDLIDSSVVGGHVGGETLFAQGCDASVGLLHCPCLVGTEDPHGSHTTPKPLADGVDRRGERVMPHIYAQADQSADDLVEVVGIPTILPEVLCSW